MVPGYPIGYPTPFRRFLREIHYLLFKMDHWDNLLWAHFDRTNILIPPRGHKMRVLALCGGQVIQVIPPPLFVHNLGVEYAKFA